MPRARIVFSRFLKRSGSIPAEEQTALKSLLSSKRNCSALRLKLNGPHIHSSKLFVITARQSLSSAVPRSGICVMELLNMVSAPRSRFCSAECLRMCRQRTTTPSRSERNGDRCEELRCFDRECSEYSVCKDAASCLFRHQYRFW